MQIYNPAWVAKLEMVQFPRKICPVLHKETDRRFNIILRDAINVAIYSLKITSY